VSFGAPGLAGIDAAPITATGSVTFGGPALAGSGFLPTTGTGTVTWGAPLLSTPAFAPGHVTFDIVVGTPSRSNTFRDSQVRDSENATPVPAPAAIIARVRLQAGGSSARLRPTAEPLVGQGINN
jgi:hypothetical protein